MNNAEKLSILEDILYQVAEERGDITPLVVARFYEDFPQGEALFTHHGGQNRSRMEADMVESAVYCLLTWFDQPAEIEIMFGHTIPHHEMLEIPPEFFDGLLAATMAVIEASLSSENEKHSVVWTEITNSLHRLVRESSLSAHGLS